MQNTLMVTPWRFVGGVTDLSLDMPGEVVWEYPELTRREDNVCGGTSTLIDPSAGTTPKREARIEVPIWPTADRSTRVTALLTMVKNRGPYTLTTPIYSLSVLCDPTVAALTERWRFGVRWFSFGIREV
jgi:hypothetical protein